MSVERPRFVEKVAEFSKKLDVLQIGAGLVILYFDPAIGGFIIVGSAITYFAADQFTNKKK